MNTPENHFDENFAEDTEYYKKLGYVIITQAHLNDLRLKYKEANQIIKKLQKTDDNSEIENINTEHTGGNIYNDVIELKDGQVLVITSDSISLHMSLDNYYEYETQIDCIDRYGH